MSVTQQTTHAHDFDFYVGTWEIHNRRLRKPLAGSTSGTSSRRLASLKGARRAGQLRRGEAPS